MWGNLLASLSILAGFAIVFIILNQIHEYSLKPQAIDDGVDSDSMDLIELGYTVLPVLVFLGWLYTQIEEGRKMNRGGYNGL